MAITKEQIFAAADALIAAGTSATLAAVRKALGAGSFTTISEGLKEWRAAHQEAATAIVQDPAPQALHEQLAGVVTAVWATALDLANARLKEERTALEQTRIALEQSRAEAADLADQLSTELEQAQATLADQSAAAAAAAQVIECQTAEAIKLTRELATASEAAHTAQAALVEAHARTEQLSALLEREQADRADATTRATKAYSEASVLASKLDAAERRATTAEKQATAAQQATERATRELATQEKLVQASHARFEGAERELTAAKKAASEARATATLANEETAELRGVVKTLREQIAASGKGPVQEPIKEPAKEPAKPAGKHRT